MNQDDIYYYKKNIKEHFDSNFDEEDEDYEYVDRKYIYRKESKEIEDE